MDCGIVGLPGSGKTTLFSALTGLDPAHLSTGGMKPNIGIAPIPDPRLGVIAEYIPPQKIIPATLRLVDIPGIPPGSDPKMLNAFLEHVRVVDAVCHVVRCFDDGSGLNAVKAIDEMETELVLADLVVAEGARDKAARTARTGDSDAKARLGVLERVTAVLDEGKASRTIDDFGDGERKILRSYGMITARPVLYVANVPEDDLHGEGEAAAVVREHAAATGGEAVAVCAKLEAELAQLDEGDRGEMLESMGLQEPAIGPLARALNMLLGLAVFYTAGDKEVRAWPVIAGASAPEAAGAIHSDIQRGFIRAECFHVNDLVQYKSEKAIREAGRLRSEGKNYSLQDGDVVHFLFNV